jgi:acyl-homoserine lactone acylase PvdQ
MRYVRRLHVALLLVMLTSTDAWQAASAQQAPPVQVPPPAGATRSEILSDVWGVPHIFAATAAEAGYGYDTAAARGSTPCGSACAMACSAWAAAGR